MSKLWEPNPAYDESEPQSLDNMPDELSLYYNSTQGKLAELLRDARQFQWEVLDLRNTGIIKLPGIGYLTNLKSLNLRGTKISELTSSIGCLINLQSLDLSATQISESELPQSIGKLTNLQSLNLSDTKISELPQSVSELTSLQSLDLSGTKISELPQSVSKLTSLQSLDLSGTKISELPQSVSKLTSLQSLNLSNTQISELPQFFDKLTNLQSLNLSGTQINELPQSVSELTSLQSLNLSSTKISEVPDSIRNLTNLQSLNLSYCYLKAIPYSIVALGLPFVINRYYRSNNNDNKCVDLSGVTLDEGNLQLFAQSRDVIEAAYRKQTQIRECKVIFLGDGGAGKTALIERITKGTFTPGTLPTDGIEVTKWFMSVEMKKWETKVNNKPFTLRFLDFGGQEIMHSAHRCFLTAHTVYVVVCDSRDDPNIDATAVRWLESVKAFAPGCPVILALNKVDLNANVSVNQRDLEKRNQNLKCVLKTSAHDEPDSRYGVNHLRDAIRDEIPGAINDYKVNADMLSVKRALEDMEDDYISSERYREICAEHHITDETLQYGLLGFFRDLGVVYYYESNALDTPLESVRVLNPEWLTNGIYRLILRTPESGFLRHKEIKKTLRAAHAGDIHREITYTPKETEYILHVMRYFEISHDMGDGVEMIPMKMPKMPPASMDEFQRKDALHLRWEGAYLPNNLIHRLLIRKFLELDTECVWRTGGRFRQKVGGCEALAEMNEKALDVYINGERDCRLYLETFCDVIRNILDGLNLKTEEIICYTVNGREGRVSYQAALSHLYNNKPEIHLANIDAYVSPVLLLKEIYVDVDRELARYRQEWEREFRDTRTVTDKPSEKAENPLDNEKTRAEIEQLKAEAKKNNVAVTLTVARALLIPALIVLAWVAGRSDFFEKLLEWLFSISIG